MSRPSRDGRPHVVSMIDSWTGGGAEVLAWLIPTRLDPARYRRTFCVTRVGRGSPDEERVRADLAAAGVEILALGRSATTDVAPWRQLVRYLRAERVDVLHAHKFGSNVWASLVRHPGRVPVAIATEHTWSYEGQPLRKLLDRHLVSRLCDRMVAVSELDRRRMIEIERIDPSKIVVIPGGMPPRTALGHDVRAELAVGDDPVVVAVGNLRAQKALGVLIEAADILRRDRPSVRILIVGAGPEEANLRAAIAARGLEATVRLLGRRDDIMDLLAAAQIAVCCSDFEGTPLAVIEYMAAAKPVVATRVGALPDLIEHGINGLLIAPRDPPALAAALAELLGDPERAAAMGRRGQERQRREHTLEAMMERLEALYAELLASGAGRSR